MLGFLGLRGSAGQIRSRKVELEAELRVFWPQRFDFKTVLSRSKWPCLRSRLETAGLTSSARSASWHLFQLVSPLTDFPLVALQPAQLRHFGRKLQNDHLSEVRSLRAASELFRAKSFPCAHCFHFWHRGRISRGPPTSSISLQLCTPGTCV